MYQFISDPGHGWLRVPLSEIEGLVFSSFSFTDGEFAYLEEDCDASVFIKAKGLSWADMDSVHVDEFDRSMDRLTPPATVLHRVVGISENLVQWVDESPSEERWVFSTGLVSFSKPVEEAGDNERD